MSRSEDLARAADAVDAVLALGGDPDHVLRAVLDALRRVYTYAEIAFVEEGELAPGPSTGAPSKPLHSVDVEFRDVRVAELRVAPHADGDDAFLARLARELAPYCLVGWDTGGVEWDAL